MVVGNSLVSDFNFYFYFVKERQGGATINKWIPHDTLKTYTPYSAWVYDENYTGTSIKENEGLGDINVFPVPSSDIVTVEFSGGKETRVKLELISLEGKTVLTKPLVLTNGKGIFQIDVQSLGRGLYFLRADYGTHVRTKKVIVQ